MLRIGRSSILNWYQTFKGPEGGYPLMPCLTNEESRLGHFLEYHPRVAYYQRADPKKSFVDAFDLKYELPVPLAIPYIYKGARGNYYADFTGWLDDGTLFIAEAGLASEKSMGEAHAKALAAIDYATAQGGVYWLGTERHINDARTYSLELLHARRIVHGEPPGLAAILTEAFMGAPTSIAEVVDAVADFPTDLVDAVAWRVVAEACAAGRLLYDLDAAAISRNAPLRILSDTHPLILPRELPSLLTDGAVDEDGGLPAAVSSPPQPGTGTPALAETVIDASSIADERKRDMFLRNLAICQAVESGAPVAEVAATYGITERSVRDIVHRRRTRGEVGIIPRATYHRADLVDEEYRRAIFMLLRSRKPVSAQAIFQSPELGACERLLTRARGQVVPRPTISQVRRIVRELKADGIMLDRVASGRRAPRWAGGKASYVHRIPQPAMLVEVDEHYFDIKLRIGDDLTSRVYGAVMVDVKTGCPMAAVLSPNQLTEEDYMRLLKMAMEPKDALKARYGFENDWPCTAKPGAIGSDNGWIFISKRARDVVVRRLNIREAIMPPGAPSAKGIVEAIFMFVTRRFAHRLPGTTFDSPDKRGAYESDKEALKAGITFEEFESFFYRALVDGYLQDWDSLRQTKRVRCWQDAVAEFGAPQFTGNPDELKLLLLKAANRKRPDGKYPVTQGGINFLGNWYRAGTDALTRRLRGQLVDIFYDRRDIVTVYVAIDGQIVGAVHAGALLQYGRLSEWEWSALKAARAPERQAAKADASRALTKVYEDASKSKRERLTAARREERAKALDRQINEIHPADVLAERARLARGGEPVDAELPPVAIHPPDNIVPVRGLKVIRLTTEA